MRVGLKAVQAIAPPRIGTTNPARRLPGRITAPITRQSPADSTPYTPRWSWGLLVNGGRGTYLTPRGTKRAEMAPPTYTHITIDEYEYK